MLTLEEIKKMLRDRNLTIVAHDSEVGYQTLTRIANGRQTNPTYQNLKKLSDYLTGVLKND